MKQQKVIFVLIFCLIGWSNILLAHQQKESYSTVLFNERTNNIEVSHRFYLHDAEHAIAQVVKNSKDKVASKLVETEHDKIDFDIISDPETQKLFATYIIDNFSLMDEQQQQIKLSVVGFEVEGKFLWIYQEAVIPKIKTNLWIQMSALQEIWPRQVNHINVELEKNVVSARLHQEKNKHFFQLFNTN